MTTSDQSATPAEPALPLDWARQTGKVDVVLRTLEAKLKKRRRRRARAAIAVASLAMVLGFSFWAVPLVKDTATVVTAPGHRETLTLSDGSSADLNASTDVRTDFRYGRRIVRMERGEAFFSVAKDAAHPFFVETPSGTIRVTGTKFNVRLEDNDAVVTLLEGSVTASRDQDASISLHPGEQLVLVTPFAHPRSLTPTEMENTISWRTGRLALDGLTLGDAAARIAAYHGKTIEVSPAVASLPLGGTCPLDDFPGFMDFLQDAFPVHAFAQADGSYRIVGQQK